MIHDVKHTTLIDLLKTSCWKYQCLLGSSSNVVEIPREEGFAMKDSWILFMKNEDNLEYFLVKYGIF